MSMEIRTILCGSVEKKNAVPLKKERKKAMVHSCMPPTHLPYLSLLLADRKIGSHIHMKFGHCK